MSNRREFLKGVGGITAALVAGKADMASAAVQALQAAGQSAQAGRRQVTIGGKRVKVIDVHAHCFFPEVNDVLKGTNVSAGGQNGGANLVLGPARIQAMDAQGVDIEAVSVNAYWYGADHSLAEQIVKIQNEKMAEWCAAHPDRFVGLASVAVQYPDLAAMQLDEAINKMGLHGVAIGGSAEGQELAAQKFDPFWAKAEELGAFIFIHPQPAPGTTTNMRLQGRGGLGAVLGNPLETTVFLAHMIYEGTLDRFPKLRICAAHGGGFLASYSGRFDAECGRGSSQNCGLKKKPSEYFKDQILEDTIVFHDENLRHLIAECGVGQIVYGTDYPFDWPVGVDFILNAPMVTNADKEAILGGTAARLLRIS